MEGGWREDRRGEDGGRIDGVRREEG